MQAVSEGADTEACRGRGQKKIEKTSKKFEKPLDKRQKMCQYNKAVPKKDKTARRTLKIEQQRDSTKQEVLHVYHF